MGDSMSIDWSAFDKFPQDTCYCRCGTAFRSHGKFVMAPSPGIVSREPCPSCGKTDDIAKVSSDPELYTL